MYIFDLVARVDIDMYLTSAHIYISWNSIFSSKGWDIICGFPQSDHVIFRWSGW
jgi:hypothetical protein